MVPVEEMIPTEELSEVLKHVERFPRHFRAGSQGRQHFQIRDKQLGREGFATLLDEFEQADLFGRNAALEHRTRVLQTPVLLRTVKNKLSKRRRVFRLFG